MRRVIRAPWARRHSSQARFECPRRRWGGLFLACLTSVLLFACGREFEAALESPPAAEAEHLEGWAASPAPPPAVIDGARVQEAEPAPPEPSATQPGRSAASAEPATSAEAAVDGMPGSTEQAQRAERLIYNAFLRVATADPEAAAGKLSDWARARGGYVLSQRGQTLQLRVPSKHFQETVGTAASVGELLDRNIDVQDVTEQYFDLETRIKNAEALEVRLRGLLARAQAVKDALAIERELARVSAELEVLKGKMRRLRELVAYSTITVEWVELEVEQVSGTERLPFPWLGTLGLSHLLDMEEQ